MKRFFMSKKGKYFLIVSMCLILVLIFGLSFAYFVSSIKNDASANLSLGKFPDSMGSCIGTGTDSNSVNITVDSAMMLESAKSGEAKITATSENIVMTATPSDADSSITCNYDLTWTWNNAGGYTQSEGVSNSNKEFTYTIEKWNGSSWSAVGSESNFLTNTTTSESVLKSGLSTLGNGEEKSDTYRIVLKWYNSDIDQESQLGKTYTGTFKFGNLTNESGGLIQLPILVAGPSSEPSSSEYFLNSNTVRRDQVNSVEFVDNANVPADALGFWDASEAQNGSVIAWYTDSGQTDSWGNILYNVYVGSNYGSVLANASSQYLFSYLLYASTIDVDLLNTSKVSNMSYMFSKAGYSATNFNSDLSGWDVSSVTDMSYMFYTSGDYATSWSIGGLSGWDVSSVTNMSRMFSSAGSRATSCSIGDLSNWNVSNVTNMSWMFSSAGYRATSWSIGDLSNWNVSNVTNMASMFSNAGQDSTSFNLDVSGWDVSSVTNMNGMFYSAGKSATTWSIGDLSGWDTSNVTNMESMFDSAGWSVTSWSIGDLSNWNVSSVTDMRHMFYYAGYSATSWSIGVLSGWDVSSVTNMSSMFQSAGHSAKNWDIGNISNWDVSKVTDMSSMFSSAGYSATSWSIGVLSGWNVSSVTDMSGMFYYAGYNATSWSVGDLSDWDVSSVTNMNGMFNNAGRSATSWSIGDLSDWDVSSVTSMSRMFVSAGYKATNFNLDLSGWNVSSVTNMSYMFSNTGYRATSFNLDLSGWDVSSVTNMNDMFNMTGSSATSWIVTIPAKTGDIDNTTSVFYGSSTSVYAVPDSGRSFTLVS